MPTGIYPRIPTVERFQSKIEIVGECWLWTAGLDDDGHGQFWVEDRNIPAHRYSWLIAGKPLAKRKVLHHTCPNKNCCNPAHLETTTRPEHASFHGQAKTHCKRNHKLSGKNVWLHNGRRHCRKCRRNSVRKHRKGNLSK